MTNSKQVWRNFLWQRETEPQNALSYTFLLVNLAYGIVFTFFSYTHTVQMGAFVNASLPPQLWGIATLVLVIVTLYSVAFRTRWVGEVVGFWGVIVWGYGLFLYISVGMWLPALVVYLPQIMFWTFWYLGVRRFYSKEDKLAEAFRQELDDEGL